MKFTLKIAVEIKRSRPEACERQPADEAPELPPVIDARIERAPGWDFESRSPAVAAHCFGFSQPPSGADRNARA